MAAFGRVLIQLLTNLTVDLISVDHKNRVRFTTVRYGCGYVHSIIRFVGENEREILEESAQFLHVCVMMTLLRREHKHRTQNTEYRESMDVFAVYRARALYVVAGVT